MDLDDLKRLAEAATPGPWTGPHCYPEMPEVVWLDGPFDPKYPGLSTRIFTWDNSSAGSLEIDDARWIAAANPRVVLALVEVARAAQFYTGQLPLEFSKLESSLKELNEVLGE